MSVKFASTPTYVIPSKYDIIPIHASDRATFKYCRRQWAWSSPSRLNLAPKVMVHGIRENLWFGTGIHYALQKYYSPLRENAEIAFQTWFELEVHGGLVDEHEVSDFSDRDPVLKHQGIEGDTSGTVRESMYRIRGLDELMPQFDQERFDELLDLGSGMMRFYMEYAEKNDNFTVIATEHNFSVPILDKNGYPLYMVDNRIMPDKWIEEFEARSVPENVFGPLWRMSDNVVWEDGRAKDWAIEKQVHARGRMDLILQDNETGRYGIKDYKTAAKVDEDYFKHLDLDEQSTTYLTLGEVEAIIYDLPYKSLEFIRYEALFKGYPKPPTLKKDGLPSIDRQKESTTAEMFAAAYTALGPAGEILFQKDEKAQSYYTWLLELGDKKFVWPEDRWRNKAQRENARIRLFYEAKDMLNPDTVLYPSPRKEYLCLNCAFRTPCLMAEDGSDYLSVLENGYERNWDR